MLHKWVSWYDPEDPAWAKDQSRRPLFHPLRTPAEIEGIVEIVRLWLYNKGLFCGKQAIQWQINDMEFQPLPSLSTIGRILRRRDLTCRRTRRYEPKGNKYPELPMLLPNQTHKVDLVGPCYLNGPIRFYSLHAFDTAINPCGIEPLAFKKAQDVLAAVYALWLRMGIPDNLQADNELERAGLLWKPHLSPRHETIDSNLPALRR